MKKYKVIVFDMDDTLLHLNTDWLGVRKELSEFFNARGESTGPEDLKPLGTKILKYCKGDRELLKEIYEKVSKYEVEGTKGIEEDKELLEILKRLKEKFKLAVFTANGKQGGEQALRNRGILELFDVVVTRDDVDLEKQKPDPEGLRVIASKIGVSTDEIIMVGNTDFDVWSGEKINAYTVLVGSLRDAKPDIHITHLRELLDVLK